MLREFPDPRANRLLGALPLTDLQPLARHFKRIILEQGTVLHETNSDAETTYFPLTGTISLLLAMDAGATIETATVGRDGAIGLPLGPELPRATTRAVALTPGSAIVMPSAALHAIVRQNERIRDVFLNYHEALLAQVQQTAACNALHPVEMRFARWLLQMDDRLDGGSLPLTQETLSQLLGVRRTTITLIANKLQNDGAIRCGRGRIEIVHRGKLEAQSCECYANLRRWHAGEQPLDGQRGRNAV